ncbi:hypothetical protein EST38_g11284 [Candolleomyces aberdarensis]|uniref:Monopolin complex subunit Csm1/Pcs1 C-terminal domain-containing protein n=1 Tax=Candolleomyces aberdarensis TaxID=2316362 RepID=A0A4Q2D571_9AGAR|nr:hypothetical protein EST38_g11284 [Candolleomyces aberdarensis]
MSDYDDFECRTTSKSKGKQKAASSAAAKQRDGGKAEPDMLEVDEEDDDVVEVNTLARDTAVVRRAFNAKPQCKNGNKRDLLMATGLESIVHPRRPQKGHVRKSAHDAKLAAENARLKDEVERLKGHLEDLKGKFNELLHTRQTEAEASMREMVKNHEEKANEKELRLMLKTEIQQSQQVADISRNPAGSALRAGAFLKGDDAKHLNVVTLYEALTRVLIPDVKFCPEREGKGCIFTCIYTWKDGLNPTTVKERSLNFTLRQCKEPSAENPGQLVDCVHYFPLSLEMESTEFVGRLGFLSKPFSFPKTQLSLFVRTLHDNLNHSQDDDD